MSKTITSGGVTFIDLTDSRKLEAYITSNLPTVQIYNQNTKTYEPDWSKTKLQLSADIYLDAKEVTSNSGTSIVWYKKIGVQSKEQVGTGANLSINSNQLIGNVGIITYICEATYKHNSDDTNPPTAHTEIVFTRVDMGLNGSDGVDGTSVNILGSYDTLAQLQAAHPTGIAGDAYIVEGDLYVWTVNNAQWSNVGNIQGPPGTNGEDSKSIVLTGDSQVFKVSKTNVITPSTIKVTAQAFNTTITNWTYSTNGGQTFLSTVPTGVSRNGNIVTITGSTITSNSIVIKASDGEVSDVFTIYKATDGLDGNDGNDGAPAPIAFLTNENVTFSANAQGQISGTTIISNIVAYEGTTKVTPILRTNTDGTSAITDIPNGMSIVASEIAATNEIMLTITIANNSTLGSASSNMGVINIPVIYPISTELYLTWSKVNSGAMGVGIKSTTVAYGVSSSSSTKPADTAWQSTIPTVAEGQYLWTRTVIDYTDDSVADTVTYSYAKQGAKGDTGSAGSSVTVSSIQYQEGTSATIPPTNTWSNSIVAVAEGKFLWTKTTFSDGKIAYGVAKQGVSGSNGTDGRGIASIVEQYYQSTSATAQSGGTWSATVPTWADGKYIWTRSVITYTDSTTSTTSPVCVTGQKGGTGGTGATGVGVSAVDVWYYQSTSATSLSGGSWSTTAPTWSDGKYVWTKTITTYTNSTTDETTAVCITGQKGSTGVGIKSVAEYYLATSSNSGVTISTTGWTTAIQTITADKKYLWNYEIITYTDNTTSTTSPIVIGVFGNTGATGATGKGIKSVTEYYLASTLSTGVTTSTTGWTTTIQSLTATNKYLWNYELITYTDNSTATINPVIIGVYGDKGDKGSQGDRGAGISSVTVTYGTSTSASTQPTSWQTTLPTVAEGSYLWTRTVTDYTDASIADTVTLTYAKQGAKGSTGSAGTSVTVSSIQYQAGTSATTAPTGTWSNSVVTVAEGSYLWTKTTFSDGKVAYGVAKQGAKGSAGINAVSFQVYAPNGYLLTKDLESLTLQTFAYEGSTAITSGATYQWSQLIDDTWTDITDATSTTYTVTQADVLKAKSYRCVMTYKSQTYTSTVTVQDKTDIYNSIMCISSNATSNDCYWVLYTLVYSDSEEVDPLLGPISINAPSSPVNGSYWYAVDAANATVTLKKYNGTSWANSTDTQSLSYYWDIINDGSTNVPLGASSKVKVVSCHDFTATATLVCEVSNVEDGLLTQSSLSITDASDPIVSATEPTATVNGQIWIKPNDNGTYLMFVWDASLNNWISSDMDTRNKVYTSRPSSYNVGDLWITASDTDHGSYLHGTLLQAQKSNTTYNGADWSPTLRYDNDIDDMKNTLNNLSQYVTITSAGLRIGARGTSGELSPFTSLFTSTELSFYQNSEKLLTLANNQLTAPRIVVEDDLEVQGSISLGDLKIIIESNGSFSFAVQK